MHLVLTDSGLGGLSICAAIERRLRQAPGRPGVGLTYVNAWPDEDRGYNSLPDVPARARAFDRALAAIDVLGPDLVVIACNTLSILYPHTGHAARAGVRVQGIVEAGLDLFEEALGRTATSALVVLGTRTTVESNVHRAGLIARGVAPARVAAVACHGLATAIERGLTSPDTDALVESCAARASDAGPRGDPFFVGLCCTHYGLVADRLVAALARHARVGAEALDPNARLVERVTARVLYEASPARDAPGVRVISKVALTEAMRRGLVAALAPISPATARALETYAHVPDLF